MTFLLLLLFDPYKVVPGKLLLGHGLQRGLVKSEKKKDVAQSWLIHFYLQTKVNQLVLLSTSIK